MRKFIKSQMQIAEARAADIARLFNRAEKDAEWAKRLDPAAYACRREALDGRGRWVWVAEGPAGQTFRFRSDGREGVNCYSHTGARYHLTVIDGEADRFACDCIASERGECKHSVALRAVRQARRMEKQGVG